MVKNIALYNLNKTIQPAKMKNVIHEVCFYGGNFRVSENEIPES